MIQFVSCKLLFTSELTLLAELKQAKTSEVQNQKKAIMDLLGGDVKLRSKRELIEKFIEENLPHIDDVYKIQDEFEQYWQDQQVLALARVCEEEQLDKEQFNALIEAYIFSDQEPIRDDVFKCLGNRPSIFAARESWESDYSEDERICVGIRRRYGSVESYFFLR